MFSKITTTIKSATMYKQEFLEVECTNGLSFCLLIDKFINKKLVNTLKKNKEIQLWTSHNRICGVQAYNKITNQLEDIWWILKEISE